MIDLSYLTEDEQEMILAVLKRDTELKNLEEERIKQLRRTEKDRSRLKYLTGEWFYETKYHRHKDRLHSSDIIRASMRERKPVTILPDRSLLNAVELSQRWAETPSCGNREKKDVFIPPELIGLIEEPSTQSQNDRVGEFPGTQQEVQRPQIKPRQNPFNSVSSQRDTDLRVNGVKEADQAPTEEPLLMAKSAIPHNAILNADNTENHLATQYTVKPVPKKRLLLYSSKDSPLDIASGDPGVKQVVIPAPRSILKPFSASCSSTDSLRVYIPQNDDNSSCSQSSATISPISLEMPIISSLSTCPLQSVSDWLERRHVRFSSMVQPIESMQGEHIMLEEDGRTLADEDMEWDRSSIIHNDHHELYVEPQSTQVSNFHITAEATGKAIQLGTECQTQKVTEEEGRSILKVLDWFGQGSQDGTLKKHKKSPVQGDKNKEEPKDHETSDAKSEDLATSVIHPKTKPSPKPNRGLFALFSRMGKKDKNLEDSVSDTEVTREDTKANSTSECQAPCSLRPKTDDNVVLQDESKMTEILQVTAEAEDGNITVCKDSLQREMFNQDEISPDRLANLKSFWERGNRGPKILSFKREAEIQESETHQTSISPFISKPSDSVDSMMGEMSALSSNTDGKPSDLDSRKFSESSISKLQTDMDETDDNDDAPGSELHEHALVEPLSKDISDLTKEISTIKLSISQQENKVSINDLRSFWEKEKNGLKVIVGLPTCPSNTKDLPLESSPQRSSIELYTSQPDIRSDTPDIMSSLDRKSLSLDYDVCPGLSRVPKQDHQDVRVKVPYVAQNTSNYKPQSSLNKHLKPSPPSPLRSFSAKDNKQSKDQDQTRTASPLQQPKVPPRDSYPKKESRMDGSPLTTFVIDINSADRNPGTVKAKPGQTHKEPSNSLHFGSEKIGETNCPEGNHMSTPSDSSELLAISLDNSPFLSTTASSQVSASGQPFTSLEQGKTLEESTDIRPIMPKERKLSTDSQSNARLARSCIPLSLQHYLGVPEQTVLDERESLERVKAEAGEASEQGNQGKISKGSPSQHSDSEEFTFDSSRSSTPEAWSFSHTSSACESEEDNPVKAALERANARPISISRSLEDLVSDPSLSAVTPNTKTSFSDPEQMKLMSMSVPAFIHQEMDYRNSDCASESSFHFDRLRSCNASSTFSVCSEAASMSSVTGSVMSIYSSDFGNVEVKGTIQFAIHYMQKLGEFHIFVVQCKDLAVADLKRNRSDPYVKCYLLPDKAKYGKRKTCVRKKTLDPAYNEILRFKIPMETLKTQKLNLSVWHNDTFGHNSFLGEVEIVLAEWDFNNTQINDYILKGRVQVPPSPKRSACGEELRAEMKVALRFLPQTSHSNKNKVNGEVQIWVKECKNLPVSRGVSIDPFVKCTILPDSSRKSRQKTRVLKRTSNPAFNHTMVYDGFRQEDLKEACAELTVWDHDRLHNHFIGGIRLGPGTGKSYGAVVDWMDSNSTEAALWERMMQSHNEWVEGVLPLRMLVMARISR